VAKLLFILIVTGALAQVQPKEPPLLIDSAPPAATLDADR
jgi:hypothetical protein